MNLNQVSIKLLKASTDIHFLSITKDKDAILSILKDLVNLINLYIESIETSKTHE